MSDSNGHPAPIPPQEMRGAINLGASQLASRVKEIAEARMKVPLPRAPILREDLVINYKGDPAGVSSGLDVDFVNEQVDAKRWAITAKLRILGIDPDIGIWDFVEIGYGEDREGRIVAHAALLWSVEEAASGSQTPTPPMSIVAP